MTRFSFVEALATIGWSQRHLATLLSCDTNLPTRWATGRAAIPSAIAHWLTELANHHERHPAPTTWRIRVPVAAGASLKAP